MAKAKKPVKPVEDADDPKARERNERKDILIEARKRYSKASEADRDNRKAYEADMKFTLKPGSQWDQSVRDERGNDRPMYEFNELRIKCKNTINHIRANRPAVKIRGVEEGDKDLAEIRQGLFQNIWNNSDADSITDYAATHQVIGGMGAWRVDTEYSEDSVDQQDIKICPFINPMSVLADPVAKDELKRDAKYWFVFSKMANEDFEAKYPNADKLSFELDDELDESLDDEESTWVAEYWKKIPATRNLCLLSNGKTIDKGDPKNAQIPEGVTILKERAVATFKIVQYIISGNAILEGPNEWAGSMFPFVLVYGEYVVLDGKVTWYGLPRYSKDAQRAHNWAMTSVIETIASAPQAKFWATPEQAKGHTARWAEANKKNFPFMLFNPDPTAPGAPQRMGGADVPVALMQTAQMTGAALNNTTGITVANEGRVSNETSGRAIRARQDEGMVATYNFGDNMGKALRRTAEITLDLIPHIYDTQRAIRILGHDGAEKYITINQPDPVTGETLNDISQGKFDIVVTTGPSFATQRQEAAEFYGQMMQNNPVFASAAADLVLKAQDYPMSDAMAERMKMMLPPQIQQAINGDAKRDPAVQAALAQVDQMQQQIQQQAQELQRAQSDVQGQQADAVKAKSAVDVQIANLKVQQANFAVDVANFKTLVAETAQKQAEGQQTQDVANDREQLSAQLQQGLANIQTEAGGMLNQFAQVMAQITQNQQPQVVVHSPPKQKIARIRRVNGELIGTVDEVPVQAAQ